MRAVVQVIKSFLRPGNVPGDLGFKFFERTKLTLVAELFTDFNFQFPAVKVAGEIEQVGLHAKLRVWGLQRRAMADIQDGAVGFAANGGMCDINTVRRQHQTGHVEICGGKTELLANAISFDDPAGNRVRPSEHLARGIEIADANGFANARAADDLTVQRHGGQSVNGEPEFAAESFEQRDIAAAFVAKNKIRTDAKALDFSQIARQVADESFAGLTR